MPSDEQVQLSWAPVLGRARMMKKHEVLLVAICDSFGGFARGGSGVPISDVS
jgi:hypothetical protein